MVSIDFIPEEYRDKIAVYEDNGSTADIYLNITPFIQNLPDIIEKVELRIINYGTIKDGEFEEREKKEILRTLEKMTNDMESIADRRIVTESIPVTITLKGGVYINVQNSNWAAISILTSDSSIFEKSILGGGFFGV